MRTLLAIIVAPTTGSTAYAALVLATGSGTLGVANPETWELILPAMLIGMVFEAFVVLPLWHLLQSIRRHRHLLFILSGAAAWLFCTLVLLVLTQLHGSELFVEAVQIFVPGLVLVLVFDLLARPRVDAAS
jgi:hypothetical protein